MVKVWVGILVALVVIGIILAITLPLVLKHKSSAPSVFYLQNRLRSTKNLGFLTATDAGDRDAGDSCSKMRYAPMTKIKDTSSQWRSDDAGGGYNYFVNPTNGLYLFIRCSPQGDLLATTPDVHLASKFIMETNSAGNRLIVNKNGVKLYVIPAYLSADAYGWTSLTKIGPDADKIIMQSPTSVVWDLVPV